MVDAALVGAALVSPDLVDAFIQACTLISAVATLIYTVILIRNLRK